MNIFKQYIEKVKGWVDSDRWLKLSIVTIACFVIEFLLIPRIEIEWLGLLCFIVFPIGILVEILLSARGYGLISNDYWISCLLIPSLGGCIGFVVDCNKEKLRQPEELMGIIIGIATACFLYLVWTSKKHSVYITLLQSLRFLLLPALVIPTFLFFVLRTDMRPNNAETRKAVEKEQLERTKEWEKWMRRQEAEKNSVLNWLIDIEAGGEKTGDIVNYGASLYDVRQDPNGRKFIDTDAGKKYYNSFTGEFEDK